MPRIDWWIMMTSLWLPWGWMTHEEINNSQKTRRAEGEEGELEREAVADSYTHMRHALRNATDLCNQARFV